MVDGRVLASGTPMFIRGKALPRKGGEPTMEEAFIGIVEAFRMTAEDVKHDAPN
jgi:hypothetical protein